MEKRYYLTLSNLQLTVERDDFLCHRKNQCQICASM